jgi:hypothetical protein
MTGQFVTQVNSQLRISNMAKKKAAQEPGPIQKVTDAVAAAAQNVLTNMGLRREKRVARRKTRRAKVATALGMTPAKPAKKAAKKKAAAKPAKKAAKKKK